MFLGRKALFFLTSASPFDKICDIVKGFAYNKCENEYGEIK